MYLRLLVISLTLGVSLQSFCSQSLLSQLAPLYKKVQKQLGLTTPFGALKDSCSQLTRDKFIRTTFFILEPLESQYCSISYIFLRREGINKISHSTPPPIISTRRQDSCHRLLRNQTTEQKKSRAVRFFATKLETAREALGDAFETRGELVWLAGLARLPEAEVDEWTLDLALNVWSDLCGDTMEIFEAEATAATRQVVESTRPAARRLRVRPPADFFDLPRLWRRLSTAAAEGGRPGLRQSSAALLLRFESLADEFFPAPRPAAAKAVIAEARRETPRLLGLLMKAEGLASLDCEEMGDPRRAEVLQRARVELAVVPKGCQIAVSEEDQLVYTVDAEDVHGFCAVSFAMSLDEPYRLMFLPEKKEWPKICLVSKAWKNLEAM